MSTTEWHVSDQVWEAYVAGRLDPAAEASIDAHVVGCGTCREAARSFVAAESSDRLWSSIQETVSQPELAGSVRWLARLGVPRRDLVLLSASSGLYLPWVIAVGAAFVVTFISGTAGDRHESLFLMLAPLVPILAVVAAFDATDPIRELMAATPYSKLRLALMRATAALAVALPITTLLGLAVPELESLAFVWLLPALGLTSLTLVAMTWLRAWTAGAVAVSAWVTFTVVLTRVDRLDALVGPVSQVAFAGLTTVLTATFVVRTLQGGYATRGIR